MRDPRDTENIEDTEEFNPPREIGVVRDGVRMLPEYPVYSPDGLEDDGG